MSHQENAPLSVIPGAIRFNTDSMKLEYYRGGPVGFGTTTQTGEWVNLTTDSPDIQTGGARIVIGGGYEPSPVTETSKLVYINASSTGNAITFGNLNSSRRGSSAFSSSTRGIFAGGYTTNIDYVTISSTGSTESFGTVAQSRSHMAGISNSTRGIIAGGYVLPSTGGTVEIEYVTIASTGNPVDFGSLSGTNYFCGGCGSSTRGLITSSTSLNQNTIEFITISTLGNAADFGDLSFARRQDGDQSVSNSIRGVFGGGYGAPSPGFRNTIDYVTIATLGNAVDFGDHTIETYYRTGASSSTRGVFAGGGNISPANTLTNVIDYIQIMSIGNAIDFGDLDSPKMQPRAVSNGHGGLG